MSSGDEADAEPIYTDMLEDVHDGRQSHLRINRREGRYKIRDHIKQSQVELKGALLSTQNMGKGLHKVFKAIVNEVWHVLPILDKSGSEVSYLIPEPKTLQNLPDYQKTPRNLG